jgi:hypothetical protein
MRYYFHVTSAGQSYHDAEGLLCINSESAKFHACLMASELARLLGKKLVGDERLEALSVQVIDEWGNEVTRMPIVAGLTRYFLN